MEFGTLFGGLLVFILVFGIFLGWLNVWRHPVEQAVVKVVSKRQAVSGGGNTTVSTSYFITLERSNGNRREYEIGVEDYSLLADGDRISCEFQGIAVSQIQRLR